MLKSAQKREMEKCGTTYPIMTLEEQKELNQLFDVKESTIQEARTTRQKRDRERYSRPYRFGDDAREDKINSLKPLKRI